MKIANRVVVFDRLSPADTGCGKVYSLASTDLLPYSLPRSASFELANQSGPGELHVHHQSHEAYICIGGEGFIFWGKENQWPIKNGDVVNIAPGTFHALNADPRASVQVLVVSYPRFTQGDIFKVPDTIKKKKKEKPSFFVSSAPQYGLLMEHAHVKISRLHIQQSTIASAITILFIISGTALFKAEDQQIVLSKYDSIAMDIGNTIAPQGNESLIAIVVQIKED